MTGTYAYTPVIWPSIFTVMLLTVLAVYAWRRRNLPGALWLVIYCLFGLTFLAAKVIEFLAVDFETKIFWFNVEYPWLTPGTTSLTCFILEYAWPGRWVTRRTLALLSIVPLLGLALLFTNDFHNLLFRGYEFTGDVVPLCGPVGWVFVVYNLGLRVVSIIALAWLFVRSPQHRWPAVLILLAETVVGVVLVLDPYIQESQFFYVPEKTIPVVACAIALFGFRIFDPIPLARQAVIEQLQAGMLVLDLEGRVISLNPAAERILNAPAKQVKGKLVKELLPACPEKRLADSGETEIELGFGEGTSLRYYLLTNSLLNDFRGLKVGRLLLLRDVTEQKRAQAQILEQQKVQVALEERQRIAAEMHDGLAQTLSYLGLKTDLAAELLEDGQVQPVLNEFHHMQEAIGAAARDVRRSIATLQESPSPRQSLQDALSHTVDQFAAHARLVVQFHTSLQAPLFLPPRELEQVSRVVQEALLNAQRHARARQITVRLDRLEDVLEIAVQDDGRGFDPARVAQKQGDHFGLSIMRARAARIAGVIKIDSLPGRGTRVILTWRSSAASDNAGWADERGYSSEFLGGIEIGVLHVERGHPLERQALPML